MERVKFLTLREKWRLYFDEGQRDVFGTSSLEESEKHPTVVRNDTKIYVQIFNMVPIKVSQDLTFANPDSAFSPLSEHNDVGATTCAADASGLLTIGHKEEQQPQILQAPQDMDSDTMGKCTQHGVEPRLENHFISKLQIKPVTKFKQILDPILKESSESTIKEAETAPNQFALYRLKFTQLLAPILEELKELVHPDLPQNNFVQYKSMFAQHLEPIIAELEGLVQPELPQNQFAQYKTKFAQHLEVIIEELEALVQPELEEYWQFITQQSFSEDSYKFKVQRKSEVSHFEDEEVDSVASREYEVERASPFSSTLGYTEEYDVSDNYNSYEMITMFTLISFGLVFLWILHNSIINNKQDFHTNPSMHNEPSIEDMSLIHKEARLRALDQMQAGRPQ